MKNTAHPSSTASVPKTQFICNGTLIGQGMIILATCDLLLLTRLLVYGPTKGSQAHVPGTADTLS